MVVLRSFTLLVTLCTLLVPASSFAHHSLLNYDDSKLVDIEGEVTSVAWRNPHSRIDLKTTTANGQTEAWYVEAGSLNAMERAGVDRESVLVGHTIRVSGFVSNRDDKAMQPVIIGLDNGQNLILNAEKAEKFGRLDKDALPAGAVIDNEAVSAAIQSGRMPASSSSAVLTISKPHSCEIWRVNDDWSKQRATILASVSFDDSHKAVRMLTLSSPQPRMKTGRGPGSPISSWTRCQVDGWRRSASTISWR